MACFCVSKKKLGFVSSILTIATGLLCSFVIYKNYLQTVRTTGKTSQKSSVAHSEELTDCRPVCSSAPCIYMANHIKSLMNETVNPCENFFTFSCGGLQERFGRDLNYSIYNETEKHMYGLIKDLMDNYEEPIPSLFGTMKTIFESCIDGASSDGIAMETLQTFLTEIGIPNWPYLNSSFVFENPSLEEVLGRLYSYQQNIFMTFGPDDSLNASLHNLMILPVYLNSYQLSKSDGIDKVIFEILRYTELNDTQIAGIVEEYIKVDTALIELMNASYENMLTESDCIEDDECTYMNCTEKYRHNRTMLCNIVEASVRNANLEDLYATNVYCKTCSWKYFYENIENFLHNYTHKELANYIALKVHINNLEILKFSFRRKFPGMLAPTSHIDRKDRVFITDPNIFCVEWLNKHLHFPLRLVYATHVLPKAIIEEVQEIYKEFMNTLTDLLGQQSWITEPMRTLMKEKAGNFSNAFYEGFAKLDEVKLKQVLPLHTFKASKDNFIRNVLEFNRFLKRIESVFLREPSFFRNEYDPFKTNAYYKYGDYMELGVGLILPPLYTVGFEKFFNSLPLGDVFGHEAGHMVEHELKNIMANETQETMEEKEECLVDQFSNFKLGRIGKNLKGNETFGENWADSVGIAVAEKVAEKYLPDLTERKFSLPGLPYSPEKLLYITYAQSYCSVASVQAEQSGHADEHSPDQFRVIGMFQNSKRFAQAFHCLPGTPMNPQKKCISLELDSSEVNKDNEKKEDNEVNENNELL